MVLRCAFCKLQRNFGFFCSVNHLGGPLSFVFGQSCMGCDLKTQNPFKVFKTPSAIQWILGTFVPEHVMLIYKRWPRRGPWNTLHTQSSACKLTRIPPRTFWYFDIWHVYTRWAGRGSERIEISKKMLTASPILPLFRCLSIFFTLTESLARAQATTNSLRWLDGVFQGQYPPNSYNFRQTN